MTKADLHSLVDQLPDAAVDGAAVLLRSMTTHRIDPDQAWFWTPEWLSGEREIDAARARGERGEIFETDDAFLDALERELKPLDG
jgi:hypothetical protein